MSFPKINGLPDLYQVRCPSPVPHDWHLLMTIVEGCESDSTGCGNYYYLIDVCNESWDNYYEPHTDEDGDEIHHVSFEKWRKLVLLHDKKSDKSVHITDDYSVANLKDKKVAIHCSTQELWNEAIALIPKCRLTEEQWIDYRKESCFIHDSFKGSYSPLSYWKEAQKYQIITAEEFIAANKKKHEYKVDDWVVVTHDQGGDPVGTVTQVFRIDPDGDIFLRNTNTVLYPNVDKWVHRYDSIRPATADEISKAKDVTTSKVRVDKTNAVIGLKVVRGQDWDYSPQDGGEGNVGVITEYSGYYPKNLNTDWTYVVWANGDGYCYRIGDCNKYDLYVYEDKQTISRPSRPVPKVKYDTPIGWKPGDSWRHMDNSCGLSISVNPKDDDPNMYFVDYGEYGTNYIAVKRINEYVEKGIWIINPKEKSKKKESQTSIFKQSKTKQNENIKEGIGISTEQCIISKLSYKPSSSTYLPADTARITAGPRRKGTAVRG